MNFIFQGSQKMHVRVAISQKGLVNFFRYAHQIKAFFIPVHTPVSLFMGRFFPLEFHSAYEFLRHVHLGLESSGIFFLILKWK